MPEGGFLHERNTVAEGVRGVTDEEFCDIRAGIRDVEIASALTEIDLKNFEFAVSDVVFDIEVGETGVSFRFKEAAYGHHQFFVIFREDGNVISDSLGGMFFKQNVSQTHHSDLGVFVTVGSQYVHTGVISGNEVLNDQRIVVAGGEDRVCDLLCFLGRVCLVDLFHAVKGILPITDGAGGLDDDGIGEGERVELVRFGFVLDDYGLGEVHAVLYAHFVEGFLGDQLLCKLRLGARAEIIAGKEFLVFNDEIGVSVGTADEDHQRALMFLCKRFQCGKKDLCGVDVINGIEMNDFAVLGRSELISAECVRFYAERFVECARNAVAVQICAEKHGDDIFFCIHMKDCPRFC